MTFQKAGDLAEQYGGAGARGVVEDGIDQMAASENEAGAGGGANLVDLLGNGKKNRRLIVLKISNEYLITCSCLMRKLHGFD